MPRGWRGLPLVWRHGVYSMRAPLERQPPAITLWPAGTWAGASPSGPWGPLGALSGGGALVAALPLAVDGRALSAPSGASGCPDGDGRQPRRAALLCRRDHGRAAGLLCCGPWPLFRVLTAHDGCLQRCAAREAHADAEGGSPGRQPAEPRPQKQEHGGLLPPTTDNRALGVRRVLHLSPPDAAGRLVGCCPCVLGPFMCGSASGSLPHPAAAVVWSTSVTAWPASCTPSRTRCRPSSST
mmetsp:Transcript_51542/g.151985  ORF Transcript_51542/g.151985 Transcript_51542/m.151985 type:complete len:240 (-) Transcript_51542:1658-2377(-)